MPWLRTGAPKHNFPLVDFTKIEIPEEVALSIARDHAVKLGVFVTDKIINGGLYNKGFCCIGDGLFLYKHDFVHYLIKLDDID